MPWQTREDPLWAWNDRSVNASSLSRANESRDYRIYEGLGVALIKIVRPMYARQRIEYIFPQGHELFALDSTTISCSIALMGWALGKHNKGAVKMHTLMDLRGSIPAFVSISDGRRHDSRVLDEIDVARNAIYTMDKPMWHSSLWRGLMPWALTSS